MSLDKYTQQDLEQELRRRKYQRENKLDNILITAYCIDKFMERSGSKNRLKAHKTLCKMYLGADIIKMKQKEKLYRLLNNHCEEVLYMLYNNWILVIRRENGKQIIKTVYKKNCNWFEGD